MINLYSSFSPLKSILLRTSNSLFPNLDKILIVYISEELASAFPIDSVGYPGFDEFKVLKDILDCAPIDKRVVVKLHPEERQDN